MSVLILLSRWSVSPGVAWAGTGRESTSRPRTERAGDTLSIAPSAIKTFTGETFKRLVSIM